MGQCDVEAACLPPEGFTPPRVAETRIWKLETGDSKIENGKQKFGRFSIFAFRVSPFQTRGVNPLRQEEES